MWLSLFLAYEIALTPLVYFKNLLTVAWATQGLFLTIWNTVAWMFSGLIFIGFFIIRDLWYMFRILTMHNGCRHAAGLQDELPKQKIDVDEEVRCFNEAREIVITKYYEVRKACLKDGGDEEVIDYDNLNILNMLEEDCEMIEQHKQEFIIKASSLVDAWKKDQTVRMKAEEEKAKEAQKKDKAESDSARLAREKAEADKKAAANSKSG